MAIAIRSPRNSFIQFDESDAIESCEYDPIVLCLPVYADNDINFQFVLVADTEGEADVLCDLTNDLLDIGIVNDCNEPLLLTFGAKTERFRISATEVLYNWSHGLPNFGSVISIGECFRIKIILTDIYYTEIFCSNCLQRISDPCHTSVIEYSNEDNAFGFDYCGGGTAIDEVTDCSPTIIEFSNISNISIPYTASLKAKYGAVPTVSVWLFIDGELTYAGINVSFDAFPPTVINADFGGTSSGVLKIS